jgi:hypothetical protein
MLPYLLARLDLARDRLRHARQAGNADHHPFGVPTRQDPAGWGSPRR